MTLRRLFPLLLAGVLAAPLAFAQGSHRDYHEHFDEANVTVPPEYTDEMRFRAVGFTRGGRSTAAVGVPGDPLTYYFGGTGGGVFKTTDAGHQLDERERRLLRRGLGGLHRGWPPRTPTSSTWAPAPPPPRGNISVGDGMYRSDRRRAGPGSTSDSGTPARSAPSRSIPEDSGPRVRGGARLHLRPQRRARHLPERRTAARPGSRCSSHLRPHRFRGDPDGSRTTRASSTRAPGAPSGSRGRMISGSEDGGIFRSKRRRGHLGAGRERASHRDDREDSGRHFARRTRTASGYSSKFEGRASGGLYRSDDGGEIVHPDQRRRGNLRQRPWYYIHLYADTHGREHRVRA